MTDYSYINARIRGMKGRLFKISDYEELISMKELSSVLLFIFNSHYGRFIVSAEKAGVNEIDEALRRDLSDTFKKVSRIAEREIKRLLDILLGRWDVYNIKTILRGRHINKTPEDIMPLLIATGIFSESLLKELCLQEDIKGIADLLVTWGSSYGYAIQEGVKEYKESGDISSLELRLDKIYFEDSLKRLNKKKKGDYYVCTMLSFQIDMLNMITAFRLLKEERLKIYADAYFIDGGEVFSKKQYKKILSANEFEEGLRLLNSVQLRSRFKITEEGLLVINDLPEMERRLEIGLLKNAISLSLNDPLNISVIIGYIWRKINEVINLRLILRGKFVEMPEQRLRKMVV
ncbi:MAG: V-type ATPase subunit [Nitrospirae bacterium]|nr:V-type ATPase subunit [Nitrospirota bacterium]